MRLTQCLRVEGTDSPACPSPASQGLPQPSPDSQHLHFILSWGHQSLAQLHDGCACGLSLSLCAVPLTGSLSRRNQCSWSSCTACSAWSCRCWQSPPNVLSPWGMAPAGEDTAYDGVTLCSFPRKQPDPCCYVIFFSVLWEAKTLLITACYWFA